MFAGAGNGFAIRRVIEPRRSPCAQRPGLGALYALYVIQAATAVITFPIALVVFYLLGYSDALLHSVLSAILQFAPIVGPGMLAVGLAGYDIVIGMPNRAVGVIGIIAGPLVVALLVEVIDLLSEGGTAGDD